jgi:hypothetical protein
MRTRFAFVLAFVLLLPGMAAAQGTVNSRTQAGDGTKITDTVAGRLDVTVQSDVETALETLAGTVSTGRVQVDCPDCAGGGGTATEAEQETQTAILTTIDSVLDSILAAVDGLEASLTTIIGHLDGLEGFVDGLETLVTSTNTKLDTVIGHVDGLEGLITTLDTVLDNILLAVDGIEASLTTIIGHLDGVEGLLTTIDGDTGSLATTVSSGKIKVQLTTSAGDEIVVPTAGLTHYDPADASTNSTNVKNGAGTVYHYSLSNTTATKYYLRMYNLSSAPTCSSATGFVESIPIPASTDGGGRERPQNIGQAFTTGISYCITASSGSTANDNAAAGVFVSILYK